MNDLQRLFTKKNLIILKDLSSKNETYIREISENTGVSPAQVHQAIKIFKKLGFIEEKKLKNKKILSLDLNNLLLSKIRQLININDMLNHSSFKELNKHGIVGIYGSFAAGKDTLQSDIDMWIYTKNHSDSIKLKNITRKIETDFRKEVKLLLLTDKKIKDLKENDPEFYFRLKLTSAGEDIFD
jgi:predicted nucleotidyltransferase